MNRKVIITLVLLLSISIVPDYPRQRDQTILTYPYLGQKPAGTTPEIFSPSILTSRNAIQGNILLPTERTEIYRIFHSPDYGQNPPVIHFVKQIDGQWTKPGILEFSGEYGAGNINILPDGRICFLGYERRIRYT